MAEKYEFDGTFPTVILLDESADKLIKIPTDNYKNTERFLSFIQEKINSVE